MQFQRCVPYWAVPYAAVVEEVQQGQRWERRLGQAGLGVGAETGSPAYRVGVRVRLQYTQNPEAAVGRKQG